MTFFKRHSVVSISSTLHSFLKEICRETDFLSHFTNKNEGMELIFDHTLLFAFEVLLWFDIEYLLEVFDEEEKHGDDRVRKTDGAATFAVQFLLSLFAVGVGEDEECLKIQALS